MKTEKVMRILCFLAIFALFLISNVAACINPTDSFASEVLLNKQGANYSIEKLITAGNVIRQSGEYVFQSQYDKKLAAIVKKENTQCKNCLLIRLQMPVETKTGEISYFSIASSIIGKNINLSQDTTNYKDWLIRYSSSIELKKEKISITISSANNKYDLIIEIDENLSDCKSCDGKCVYSQYGETCIGKELKDSIEDVLKFSGLIDNFDDLFYSFKVIGKGNKIETDLQASAQVDVDWKEALREELVWLKKHSIIEIADKDIENIAILSKEGTAGNSKIAYSQGKDRWMYYYETENPLLSKEFNCNEFSFSAIPEETPSFGLEKISLYYLVPIVIIGLFVLILLALFLISLVINKRDKIKRVRKTR